MTLPVVWLPEADAELRAAWTRYDAIRPELGQRFADAVTETVERIASGPLHFAIVSHGRRRAGVHRFPHGIFFIVEETRMLVIACFHGRRNPREWMLR